MKTARHPRAKARIPLTAGAERLTSDNMQEGRSWGCGGGNGDLRWDGYGVSVWGDEGILEMDGGNGTVFDATELCA